MFVRRIAIENVRSFLDRREIRFEGGISILIGPNGGGKTNLLSNKLEPRMHQTLLPTLA